MLLRKAKVKDVPAMQALINSYAGQGLMLARSLNMLYESTRDFVVAEIDGQIVGTGALHIVWQDLGELRAVAVAPDRQKNGIGRSIVETLLREARDLELSQVFALTYKPNFFVNCGFRILNKEELPHKVWKECINCPKFPNCDEIALILDLADSLSIGPG